MGDPIISLPPLDEARLRLQARKERQMEARKEYEAAEWRSIGTIPKDGRRFVACDAREKDDFLQIVAWDEAEEKLVSDIGAGHFMEVGSFTHWHPLPPIPRARS